MGAAKGGTLRGGRLLNRALCEGEFDFLAVKLLIVENAHHLDCLLDVLELDKHHYLNVLAVLGRLYAEEAVLHDVAVLQVLELGHEIGHLLEGHFF